MKAVMKSLFAKTKEDFESENFSKVFEAFSGQGLLATIPQGDDILVCFVYLDENLSDKVEKAKALESSFSENEELSQIAEDIARSIKDLFHADEKEQEAA